MPVFFRFLVFGFLLLSFFQWPIPIFSQEESSKPKVDPQKLKDFHKKPQIIPAHPDAVGGGNPFQGLGRPDEKHPSRVEKFLESMSQRSSTEKTSTTSGTSKAPPGKAKTGQAAGSEKEDSTDTIFNTTNKENQNSIVPPPPRQTSSGTLQNTPHRKALALIHKQSYAAAQTVLDDVIIGNPRDYRARYLRAYVFVMTRNNKAAIKEYEEIIKNSKDQNLINLARNGLKKLTDH